ncbi:MAG: septum formation initiator family protein [Lachnospiraceae bacterium]|nr:septum formation initiator family protein [Lachnospiraceae bacterium]
MVGLCTAIGFGYVKCKRKQEVYDERLAALQAEIDEQNQRALDLEEMEKYTHTKKYVEEVAKDRLGLVYPGEIVFVPEE